MEYIIRPRFSINRGFVVTSGHVHKAATLTNKILSELPRSLFTSIDYKTTSALVGSIFCQSLTGEVSGAMVNPIEKGHPDIIPKHGADASEEKLRNYPEGLEVKCTIGNVRKGSGLSPGHNRLNDLTGITWQAHHREVADLLGLVWDFENLRGDFKYPIITGVFYAGSLDRDDWGAISGTTGRNTKVCGMKASGRLKMGNGWALLHKGYFKKYHALLGSKI